jgi:hypothetical protein
MPRRLATLPALGVLALALVACGGGSTTAPSAAAPTSQPAATAAASVAVGETGGGVAGDLTPGTSLDACAIVTPADVKQATSIDVVADGTFKKKPDSLSPGKSECTYQGDFGRIIVTLVPEDGANLYDAARGSYKDASDITGIGDGAFNSVKNNRAFVWKERVTVMLTMFLSGDLEQLPVATDLGKAIIAKL